MRSLLAVLSYSLRSKLNRAGCGSFVHLLHLIVFMWSTFDAVILSQACQPRVISSVLLNCSKILIASWRQVLHGRACSHLYFNMTKIYSSHLLDPKMSNDYAFLVLWISCESLSLSLSCVLGFIVTEQPGLFISLLDRRLFSRRRAKRSPVSLHIRLSPAFCLGIEREWVSQKDTKK